MTTFALVPFAAAFFSTLLATARLFGKKPSLAGWLFCAGMVALAIDNLLTGLAFRAAAPQDVASWLAAAFVVKSITPGIWLAFSLSYSRGSYAQFLSRWKLLLVIATVLPTAIALTFREHLLEVVFAEPPGTAWVLVLEAPAKALSAVLLVTLVLIVMNLEQTFRAAVGTMRWQIKFVVLAFAVIFGTQIYARSQGILFSVHAVGLPALEAGGLLIGCLLLAVAYSRTGLAEIEVFPSLAVLRSSLTVLIVGAYLLGVGVLAQIVRRVGGEEIFQFHSFVVLVGLAGLGVLLLSDRARQALHTFVARHFSKAQHDSVAIWTMLSHDMTGVSDRARLATLTSRFVSETFGVLSVNVWFGDDDNTRLVLESSTASGPRHDGSTRTASPSDAVIVGLRERSAPFDLEALRIPWAQELRHLNPVSFANGGNRLCVPLVAGDQVLGAIVLADRVGGGVYTVEESELLACIATQVSSVLLNVRLAAEVAHAKELDAFRTMSAFFVHDLKNAAASLNLMLKNLPVHFDDPDFRRDALRGISNTAKRIDVMIARLSTLRQRPELLPVETDLNALVDEAIERFAGAPNVGIEKNLLPLPTLVIDRDHIRSVVTNLVLNARDAVGANGKIAVRTRHIDGSVLLTVEDNGCGMSQEFVTESLFRPFQSTKKQGLGIGLFQCRAIVRAHGGSMQVTTELGKGTTFTVSLPVVSARDIISDHRQGRAS